MGQWRRPFGVTATPSLGKPSRKPGVTAMSGQRKLLVALGTCVGLLSATPAIQAQEAAKLLIGNYFSDEVIAIEHSGSSEVVYTSADGLSGPFGSNALVFDTDGNLLVGNFNSHAVVRGTDGHVVADAGDGVVSPDGLAYGADGTLYIANRDGLNILSVTGDGTVAVFDDSLSLGRPMTISVGGNWLYVANDAGELLRYNLSEPAAPSVVGTFGVGGGNVAITALAGGNLVYLVDDGSVKAIIPGQTSSVLATLPVGADEGIALAPESFASSRLYVADFSGFVYEVDTTDGDWSVFASRDTHGLSGPSGLLFFDPAPPDPCAGFTSCDTNCDGFINSGDIDPFVMALDDPPAYAATYPDCDMLCTCDVNGDGFVNAGDIDPFVLCLSGP